MKRPAFTVVELLVVIGIIGILIAMFLPAVQMVREAGRRTVCANNVRQLSLGLLNYEAANSQLPIGLVVTGGGSGAPEFYGMSWITRILPFIEQTPLWDQALEDYRLNPIPFRLHRGMQTSLVTLNCPSDPASGRVQFTYEGYVVACTDYLGVNGTNYQARDGLFTFDQSTRLADIADGQSNTLLIGERPPSADFWYGWWYASGQGSNSTGDATLGVAELNPSTSGVRSYLEDCPSGPYQYGLGRNEQCDALHFWSYHGTGANFALADGSVHVIPYTTDDITMRGLATRNGGEAVTIEF